MNLSLCLSIEMDRVIKHVNLTICLLDPIPSRIVKLSLEKTRNLPHVLLASLTDSGSFNLERSGSVSLSRNYP